MTQHAVLVASLVSIVSACSGPQASAPTTAANEVDARPSAAATRWTFDGDEASAAPPGFSFGLTGSGKPGRWVVHAESGAPSGAHVLAQLDDDDTDYRFPVAVADAPSLRDVKVGVRCMLVSGEVDQACGLVARYMDQDNYLITRANALENNIRLYFVEGGKRKQIASWSGEVTPKVWHDYSFELRGDHLQVWWDGKRVIDHHDATFTNAGKLGLWTKADSVTYFDDLEAAPL